PGHAPERHIFDAAAARSTCRVPRCWRKFAPAYPLPVARILPHRPACTGLLRGRAPWLAPRNGQHPASAESASETDANHHGTAAGHIGTDVIPGREFSIVVTRHVDTND